MKQNDLTKKNQSLPVPSPHHVFLFTFSHHVLNSTHHHALKSSAQYQWCKVCKMVKMVTPFIKRLSQLLSADWFAYIIGKSPSHWNKTEHLRHWRARHWEHLSMRKLASHFRSQASAALKHCHKINATCHLLRPAHQEMDCAVGALGRIRTKQTGGFSIERTSQRATTTVLTSGWSAKVWWEHSLQDFNPEMLESYMDCWLRGLRLNICGIKSAFNKLLLVDGETTPRRKDPR